MAVLTYPKMKYEELKMRKLLSSEVLRK